MSDEPDDPIVAALGRLEAGQSSLQAGQTSLRVDLMARMDRLEDGLTAIRNDIAVNFGAADTVRRANDNTREEVRSLADVVSALVRKVRMLETRVRTLTGDP